MDDDDDNENYVKEWCVMVKGIQRVLVSGEWHVRLGDDFVMVELKGLANNSSIYHVSKNGG